MSDNSISRNNTKAQIALLWNALHSYRETCIPEGDQDYDNEWNEICSAMAFIDEDLTEHRGE